jgi:hypothetical protein
LRFHGLELAGRGVRSCNIGSGMFIMGSVLRLAG